MAPSKFILSGLLLLAACAPSPLYVDKGHVGTVGEIPRDGNGEPVWNAIRTPAASAPQPAPVAPGIPASPTVPIIAPPPYVAVLPPAPPVRAAFITPARPDMRTVTVTRSATTVYTRHRHHRHHRHRHRRGVRTTTTVHVSR